LTRGLLADPRAARHSSG